MSGQDPHVVFVSTPGPQLGLGDTEMSQGRPLTLRGSLPEEETRKAEQLATMMSELPGDAATRDTNWVA